ncbi:LOG family protein [Staphylococcus equorum]|uniref:LOG family protein n=1 Tax=Staphylococcus equorum TaxID=246432 RepID=UPI003D808B6F
MQSIKKRQIFSLCRFCPRFLRSQPRPIVFAIALPGGPSTLEEITEVVSWSRVGENNSPCIFLNMNNYYKPMEDMSDDMVKNGFLTLNDREKTLFSDSLEIIENFIVNYEKPSIRSYK